MQVDLGGGVVEGGEEGAEGAGGVEVVAERGKHGLKRGRVAAGGLERGAEGAQGLQRALRGVQGFEGEVELLARVP